jgi:hypothetical protein
VYQEEEKVVLEGISTEAMDGAATDLGIRCKEWLEETEVIFGKAKEIRRIPVEIKGTHVDHYQMMSLEEKIKLAQRNISKVSKDRPRRDVDDIVTEIILGNEEDIDGILLDWTRFNKRTKTDQDEGTSNKQLRPEHVKTIKVKSKVGGWSKPTEEVLHEYLIDLERLLIETGNSLQIQRVKERRTTLHDLIGHMSK